MSVIGADKPLKTNKTSISFESPMVTSAFFLFTGCEEPSPVNGRSSKSRSSFSVEQVMQLERVFERQKYLGSRDRQRLAEQLQMSETQVNKLFLGVGWALLLAVVAILDFGHCWPILDFEHYFGHQWPILDF